MNSPSPIHPKFEVAFQAIDAGEVEQLRELLQTSPELANARDDDNQPLLICLAIRGDEVPRRVELARTLLEAGAKVDARSSEDEGTALAYVLCSEDVEMIPVLLEFGADVHASFGEEFDGSVLDAADQLCQDEDRTDDDEIEAIRELFSEAAGHPIPTRTPIGAAIPVLFVSDYKAGLRYYCEVLGFQIVFEDGTDEEISYACIERGGLQLHLSKRWCEDQRHVGNLSIRAACEEVDPLYEELRSNGVKIRREPKDEEWGSREFQIEDPDGNWIKFFGPIPEEED
ncbi:MAG: hypothetical protein CMJ78_16135 [Planctomycetaceae bacterium]|nr:hypothetical protein [Planctomycetaceae bacterium]